MRLHTLICIVVGIPSFLLALFMLFIATVATNGGDQLAASIIGSVCMVITLLAVHFPEHP
jgi:hypothetical protein